MLPGFGGGVCVHAGRSLTAWRCISVRVAVCTCDWSGAVQVCTLVGRSAPGCCNFDGVGRDFEVVPMRVSVGQSSSVGCGVKAAARSCRAPSVECGVCRSAECVVISKGWDCLPAGWWSPVRYAACGRGDVVQMYSPGC